MLDLLPLLLGAIRSKTMYATSWLGSETRIFNYGLFTCEYLQFVILKINNSDDVGRIFTPRVTNGDVRHQYLLMIDFSELISSLGWWRRIRTRPRELVFSNKQDSKQSRKEGTVDDVALRVHLCFLIENMSSKVFSYSSLQHHHHPRLACCGKSAKVLAPSTHTTTSREGIFYAHCHSHSRSTGIQCTMHG